MEFHFFNPCLDLDVSRRHLPHWEQENAFYFLTWRTADSVPKEMAMRYCQERSEWLQGLGIDSKQEDWQREVELLPEAEHREFYRRFTARWQDMLDEGLGDCALKHQEVSAVVQNSLLYGDGQTHVLEAFVVMPNHVHVLAGIAGRRTMKRLCRNWKNHTARKINRHLGRSGQFWQWESFDHLVRSPHSLEKFKQYIAGNPAKAGLKKGEYRLWIREK